MPLACPGGASPGSQPAAGWGARTQKSRLEPRLAAAPTAPPLCASSQRQTNKRSRLVARRAPESRDHQIRAALLEIAHVADHDAVGCSGSSQQRRLLPRDINPHQAGRLVRSQQALEGLVRPQDVPPLQPPAEGAVGHGVEAERDSFRRLGRARSRWRGPGHAVVGLPALHGVEPVHRAEGADESSEVVSAQDRLELRLAAGSLRDHRQNEVLRRASGRTFSCLHRGDGRGREAGVHFAPAAANTGGPCCGGDERVQLIFCSAPFRGSEALPADAHAWSASLNNR